MIIETIEKWRLSTLIIETLSKRIETDNRVTENRNIDIEKLFDRINNLIETLSG